VQHPTFLNSLDCAESKIGQTLSKSCINENHTKPHVRETLNLPQTRGGEEASMGEEKGSAPWRTGQGRGGRRGGSREAARRGADWSVGRGRRAGRWGSRGRRDRGRGGGSWCTWRPPAPPPAPSPDPSWPWTPLPLCPGGWGLASQGGGGCH
jgi:hypothetical protein